jgi:hypothetical protein
MTGTCTLSNQPARANIQHWTIFDDIPAVEEFKADGPTKGDTILTHSDGPRPVLNKAATLLHFDLLSAAIATA